MALPLDLIVCPVCHGEVIREGPQWRCKDCERAFGKDGRLDLTPMPPPDLELRDKWPVWERLQQNFLTAATAVPEHSLSVTERPDAEAFARFCSFSGIVLDVGCGTQTLPTYADTTACRFVGIDPLPGEPQRAFEFVQGLGEYLPFRDGSLDQVLFATSLDHMLIPRRALAEACRVLRPGGAVNVWFGEIDRPSSGGTLRRVAQRVHVFASRHLGRAATSAPPEPRYIAELEQPDGAVDKFHVAHPGAREISAWFDETGLTPHDVERVDYASGCFLRGVKPAA